jgi:hypothetical protein
MCTEKYKNFIHPQTSDQKNARILLIILAILMVISFLWIWNPLDLILQTGKPIAYIYQNGELLEKINLESVHTSYKLMITNIDEQWNEVEVRPGSIGIIHANCPSKLCVSQGFVSRSLLPITCLPHRLVIRLQFEDDAVTGELPMDAITY